MGTDKIKYNSINNFIDGLFVENQGESRLSVFSPVDGSLLTTVSVGNHNTLCKAVESARKAFENWSKVPIKQRVQIFYRYRQLLEENITSLSELITEENGKTFEEAKAEIEKAIELTEFACSMPQIIGGRNLEVSKGIECKSVHVPLGVVSSIVPFNFPSMVPHWTIPNALILGNTMVIKPSEKVPISMARIAGLLKMAGLPDGVINIVNGKEEIVNAICEHPDIMAISFVGSTRVAKLVYQKATHNLKRCLALGGAKNHLFLFPDADPDMSAKNIVASAMGCAGQRCMAASVVLAVGNVDHIIEKMVTETQKIKCGQNLGAVISMDAKVRIESYITQAKDQGANILVDGRGVEVMGKEGGYYVGPTIIDKVTPEMTVASEEVFGPVLAIIRVKDWKEALRIENSNQYGNAAGIFTRNGGLAQHISENVTAGMVGVNIGVPVPREPFSFGGWNNSKFGTLDITGESSIEFWTKLRKISTKWNPQNGQNWMG